VVSNGRAGVVAVGLCAALWGAACAGDDDGSDMCGGDTPATPEVLEPAAGSVDVMDAALAITTSEYAEPGGQAHAATEMQIWRLDGDQLDELVWSAALEPPADLTHARLADGSYQGSALAAGTFASWDELAVRVRYRSACGAWSDWSAPQPFRTDDGSAYLFDPEVVRVVELEISPESMSAIDAQAVGPWPYVPDRDYYTGTLRFEGQDFEGVGIRVKGGCGSSRNLTGKAGFKISLGWDDPAAEGCPEERRLYGQKHLTLNNEVQDPSFERERLGYQLYRAFGVPAPRAAHVRLKVNGEDWGLYLHVESLDRRFLSRWFGSNDGMMYEGGPFCDLVPDQVPPGDGDACFDQEFSADACDQAQPGQDPMDWELLRQLAEQIAALPEGGFYPAVEEFFDFDELLSSFAVTAVIADWDGYEYGNVNNYRVYHDPSTGRWSLIQTGIDNSFDSNPSFDFWAAAAVLATRCLGEPPCAAAFAARVAAATDLFESLDLAAEADHIHTQIWPEIMSDPRKEVTNEASQSAHDSLVSWILGRPAAVRASLADHGF
jgi:hypothetical protein